MNININLKNYDTIITVILFYPKLYKYKNNIGKINNKIIIIIIIIIKQIKRQSKIKDKIIIKKKIIILT